MTAPLAITSYATLGLLALRQHSASEVAAQSQRSLRHQYDLKTPKAWAGKWWTLTLTTPFTGSRDAVFRFR